MSKGARSARRARGRAAFVVLAISALCLLPALSLAQDGSDAPMPGDPCPFTGTTGIEADDPECVPPTETTPEPAPAPDPKEPSADAPATSGDAPATSGDASAGPQPAGPADGPGSAASEAAPLPSGAAGPAPKRKSRTGTRAARTVRERDRAEVKRGEGPGLAAKRDREAEEAAKAAEELIEGADVEGWPHLSGAAGYFVTSEPVIPRFLIGLFQEAGRRYGIPWSILAAINEIETEFGRNVAVSSAGAKGWMQFMPDTWRAYGVDADQDDRKDPNNPRDAIFAAARFLRAHGAPGDMRKALFAYNHASWYVDAVLLRAERIAGHRGERSRTLRRVLRAGQGRLAAKVLKDDRIQLYDCGRQDVASGRIDPRVLAVLRFLATSGLHPTVTSLHCGHGTYTRSGNVSAHAYGAAVDITEINNVPILGHQGPGSVTDATIRELLTLRGALAPAEIISLMAYDGASNTMSMGDHADHIHVGFSALGTADR